MDEAQVADVVAPEADAAPAPEIQNDAPTEAVAAEAPPPVQEKMIPQSQLDKLIAREKRQAAEKARSETLAEIERNNIAKDTAPPPVQNLGGIPQISPEQLQQHIMQAAQRMSVQMTADKMAQDFESKINAEIQADPDFGDAYDALKIAQHPELVIWMNGMDNSAKVVKDLANNPSKYAHILMLAKSGMPELAQKELNKLHESIKVNQAALAQPKAKEPLDQLTPTNIGTGNGEKSVSDFQKESWLRG